MTTPHDALFKAIFSEPRDAAGLIRPMLPEPVAQALDWSTLAVADGSFVDEALRPMHADLLFDVRFHGRPAHVYLLAEHRSQAERFTALHLLRYVASIWTRWLEQHPRERYLPPVLPVVLHHDRRPWRAPTSLRELLDVRGLDATTAEALLARMPAFTFPVDDLATSDDENLRARDLSALARLSLVCMRSLRHATPEQALSILERWLDAFRVAVAAPDGALRMPMVWSYVLQVTHLLVPDLVPLAHRAGRSAEETLMSTADKLRAEGRTEGEVAGQARILLRQLTQRFGPLPSHLADRVRTASSAELERWGDAVLTADSLAAIFERS